VRLDCAGGRAKSNHPGLLLQLCRGQGHTEVGPATLYRHFPAKEILATGSRRGRDVALADFGSVSERLRGTFGSSSLRPRFGADGLGMTIGSVSFNNASAVQGASGHARGPKPPAMDNTAEALGLSTDDLQGQLKSGKTLDDVAKAQGVSSDDLLKALKSDLTANKPAGAPELSDDQLTGGRDQHRCRQGPARPGWPGWLAAPASDRRRRLRDRYQPRHVGRGPRNQLRRTAAEAAGKLQHELALELLDHEPVHVQQVRSRRGRGRRHLRLNGRFTAVAVRRRVRGG
jgi:hypothetical protein